MSEPKTVIAQALFDYGSGGASGDLEDMFVAICEDQTAKILDALDAAGLAIVPKVPTEAMLEAVWDWAALRYAVQGHVNYDDTHAIWSAMLTAAGART